jgi:hypothetical protein
MQAQTHLRCGRILRAKFAARVSSRCLDRFRWPPARMTVSTRSCLSSTPFESGGRVIGRTPRNSSSSALDNALEDFLEVVNGRKNIEGEIADAVPRLRMFLAETLQRYLELQPVPGRTPGALGIRSSESS